MQVDRDGSSLREDGSFSWDRQEVDAVVVKRQRSR